MVSLELLRRLPGRFRRDGRLGTGHAGWRQAVEFAVLPLAGPPDIGVDVAVELDLAGDGVERAGLQFLDDRRMVDLADALDRLLQHLQAGIGHRARPAVGLLAGHFDMALQIFLELRIVGIDPADTEHAFDIVAEKLLLVDREGGAHRGIEGGRVVARGDRRAGQSEGVGRIAEGDEGIGAGRLRRVDELRKILGGDRVALVEGELEAGLLQRRPCGGGQLDAEGVGDADHGDLVVDLAVGLELRQDFGECIGAHRRGAEHPEAVRPALGHLIGLVGGGGRGEMRIAVFVEGRADGEVHAGAPWREHDVDLVLVDQALGGAHQLFGARLIVIFDHLDRDQLVAELDAAGLLEVAQPELVVGDGGDAGARGIRPGLRYGIADLDLVLRRRSAGGERHEGAGGQGRSEFPH